MLNKKGDWFEEDGTRWRRTGGYYSFGGVEYEVVFPNGDITSVWTGPWDDERSDEEKDAGVGAYAKAIYASGQYLRMINKDGNLIKKYACDMTLGEWTSIRRRNIALLPWQAKMVEIISNENHVPDNDGAFLKELMSLSRLLVEYTQDVLRELDRD